MEKLGEVLAHRRWVRRQRPFPHVVAQNVFVPEFYAELEAHFRSIERRHYKGSNNGYAAVTSEIRHHPGPLQIFLSREWHDLIAGLGGVVRTTGDVTVALHHHEPGGEPGWPHHDLAPGWYGDPPPGPHEVQAEDDRVDYFTGACPDGVTARETIRAVSVLYYLGNPEWSPGDGGETGLYPSHASGLRQDGTMVPPINNSIVVFECTPYSWHAYAGYARHERNCVVMWVHRPKQDVIDIWGESGIVYW